MLTPEDVTRLDKLQATYSAEEAPDIAWLIQKLANEHRDVQELWRKCLVLKAALKELA